MDYRKHVHDGVTQGDWKELCTAFVKQSEKTKLIRSLNYGDCALASEIWPGSELHLWHFSGFCISLRQVAGDHQDLSAQ